MTALNQVVPKFEFDLDALQQLTDRDAQIRDALRATYRNAVKQAHGLSILKRAHRGTLKFIAPQEGTRAPNRLDDGRPCHLSALTILRGEAEDDCRRVVYVMRLLNEECLRLYGRMPFNATSVELHHSCLRHDVNAPFLVFEIVVTGNE